jgi:GNAT superfamily N-acetyltransferase
MDSNRCADVWRPRRTAWTQTVLWAAEAERRQRGDQPGQRLVVATTYLHVIPKLTRSASPYAVVEEKLRGAGLGKQITVGTLRAAWNAGCYKVMLLTGSRNLATHGFYRACGFSGDERSAYVARPS